MERDEIRPPRELSPGIWRLPPASGTFISCSNYLILDKTVTLIDCGFRPGQQRYFEKQVEMIGCSIGDVERILYTHHHIDHTSGGVLLSHCFGMRHRISGSVSRELRNPDSLYDSVRHLPRMLLRDSPGLGGLVEPEQWEALNAFYLEGSPFLGALEGSIEGLSDGEIVDLGTRRLTAMSVPGHSPHDMMFFDPESGALFCGDSLVVSDAGFNYLDGGDIRTFRQSMQKVLDRKLEVKLVLPGHFDPIRTDAQSLIGKSLLDMDLYSGRILDYLREMGPKSAVDMFVDLRGTKNKRWMSFFSTHVSYLKYLLTEGEIIEAGGAGGGTPSVKRYATSAS